MISRSDLIEITTEAQRLALKTKEKEAELRKLGKSVSCTIRGTAYSKVVWDGTEEEFKQYILEKYYDKDEIRRIDPELVRYAKAKE